MATTYSRETAGKLNAAGRSAIEPHAYRAKLHRLRATIDYDGQASGDDIVLGTLPAGAIFAYGVINPKAGAGGTATIAIGKAGATGKYRAAAIANTAGPALFGLADAAAGDPLASDETVIATIGAASLPNSTDFMVVDLYYSTQG